MGLAGLLRPRCLRPRHQRCRDVADQVGVRAGGGKGEPHTRRHLDNARTDAAAPIRIGGNDVSTGSSARQATRRTPGSSSITSILDAHS